MHSIGDAPNEGTGRYLRVSQATYAVFESEDIPIPCVDVHVVRLVIECRLHVEYKLDVVDA